jgi:hypothetical protein
MSGTREEGTPQYKTENGAAKAAPFSGHHFFRL